MIFTDIRLQNFRSYKDASFELDKGVNIVVGPNTAGKTNLLEAIMAVSIGRSYRVKDIELVKKTANWARVDIHGSKNQQRTLKITAKDGKAEKTFQLDGKETKRLGYGQRQPIILFEPNHLFLFHDEPKKRRDFIDSLLSQTDEQFQKLSNTYKRVLAQRNSLLKQRRAKQQIFVWNLKLAESGGEIVTKRLALLGGINQRIPRIYSDLAASKSKIRLDYISSVSTANYGSDLLKKLEANFVRDVETGFTGDGPHRDDIATGLNGADVAAAASRGEIRTLMLALKIIETKLVEERTDKRPLLLLDDVFSELDGARRKALTDFLGGYQAIITTTDADVVVKNFSQRCQIIPLG
jgi:DNA replication and repair protein RecF